MSTGDTSRNESRGRRSVGSLPVLPVVVAALALIVAGVGVGWLLFSSDGDGSETTTDTAITSSTLTDDSSGDDTSATAATDDEGNLATDNGVSREADSNDGGADDGNDAAADDEGDGAAGDAPVVPTTAGSGDTTDETAEADEGATPDNDVPDDDPTEIATTTTTVLSADGARCQITPSDVNGQSGVIKPGDDGICGGIEVTLRSVVDTADIGSIDWANDLKLCEKHPSATQIGFAVSSASGSTEVTDTFFRGDVADGQDLVDALNISFGGGYAPGGGVQPIAVCRSTDAEMVIVHRGNG